MSHLKFERNLKSIYSEMAVFEDIRSSTRIKMLFNVLEEEKDFRYLVPLMLLPGFDFNYFYNTLDVNEELRKLIHHVYVRVRQEALSIKKSILSRKSIAPYHRCSKSEIDLFWYKNDAPDIKDSLITPIYDYKLQAEFFYESEPSFNTFGPCYLAVKDKLSGLKNISSWTALPIEERKLSNSNCVIEYYIYTGKFPVEARLIRRDAKKLFMYLKPTVSQLRAAIKQLDPQLLGYNLSEYEQLPMTVKRNCHTFIKENYAMIKKYTKARNLPYLNAWRLGNYTWKKETRS